MKGKLPSKCPCPLNKYYTYSVTSKPLYYYIKHYYSRKSVLPGDSWVIEIGLLFGSEPLFISIHIFEGLFLQIVFTNSWFSDPLVNPTAKISQTIYHHVWQFLSSTCLSSISVFQQWPALCTNPANKTF